MEPGLLQLAPFHVPNPSLGQSNSIPPPTSTRPKTERGSPTHTQIRSNRYIETLSPSRLGNGSIVIGNLHIRTRPAGVTTHLLTPHERRGCIPTGTSRGHHIGTTHPSPHWAVLSSQVSIEPVFIAYPSTGLLVEDLESCQRMGEHGHPGTGSMNLVSYLTDHVTQAPRHEMYRLPSPATRVGLHHQPPSPILISNTW